MLIKDITPNETTHRLAPLALVAGSVAARAATMIPRVVQGTVKVAKAAEKVNDAVDTVTTVNDAINGDNEEKRDVHDMHVIRTFNRVDYLAARQDPNQRAWQLCREQLGNATVTFSAPAQGGKYCSSPGKQRREPERTLTSSFLQRFSPRACHLHV